MSIREKLGEELLQKRISEWRGTFPPRRADKIPLSTLKRLVSLMRRWHRFNKRRQDLNYPPWTQEEREQAERYRQACNKVDVGLSLYTTEELWRYIYRGVYLEVIE